MKAVLQYSSQDLREIIAAHATSLGYAVLPDQIDMPDDIVVLVEYVGVPRPVVPPAPTPPITQAPGGPVAAQVGAEYQPRDPPPPPEGQWHSRAVQGDPRYVAIEEPSVQPRQRRVRELGHDTGLVEQLYGPGFQPDLPKLGPGQGSEPAPTDESTPFGIAAPDFLDDYLK